MRDPLDHSPDEPVAVLLVDDRPENLLALEAVLASPEYKLVRASSGREALRCLLEEDFAAVLLDVNMPEMDGFETAALIRQRPRSETTPIIFLTAVHGDAKFIGRGYEAGGVDYIVKPFEPPILRSKVRIFAELYRKNRAIQRHTEALFREREERARLEAIRRHYDDLVNWLDHSIIWEMDPARLALTFVSRKAEAILGHPHAVWLANREFFFDLIPPQDRDAVRARFQAAIGEGKDQRCEHRMRGADGTLLWFHTGLQCETSELTGKLVLRGLSVDISPLKCQQEELQLREAKFRRVVESNMLGHLFGDTDGRISDANQYFVELTGYDRDELVSGGRRFWDMTATEHRHLDEGALRELRTNGVCGPYEKELVRRDGTRIPVMIGMAFMEASTTEWVGFVLDLTARKQTEEERNRAIRAREELLQIVSHDLRSPLGTILLNASLLYRTMPAEADPETVRKKVASIHRSAEAMKRLVEDLLDLAHAEAGQMRIEKKLEDAASLLRTAQELFEPLAEPKGIRLSATAAPDEVPLSCDRERLLQVFSNVLGNALKFTPPGGTIELGLELGEATATFSVSDTGSGIAREHLAHVFERYWQGNRAERTGLGLGLFIAKAIVDAHGGRIGIESEVGQGTTVRFTLPR